MVFTAGILAPLCLPGGEVLRVAGKGEVPVPAAKKQKDQAGLNQQALAQAEEMAVRKAIKQAVVKVYGTEAALGANAQEVLKGAADSAALFVLDKSVTSAGVVSANAVVEMVVQVDGKALRDFLEENYGLNLALSAGGQFKVYVLSYTVEGMDPNRAQPQVLHEEYVEDVKNVQASSQAWARTQASASSSASSVQGSYSSSDQGKAQYKSSGSVDYSNKAAASGSASSSGSAYIAGSGGAAGISARESATFSASESERLKAKQKESGSAQWDSRESASIDARASQSSASYSHSARAGSSYSDTSRYVKHVVDYADPSKKGQGATNSVRAKLEGMYTSAGFTVATLDINLMRREFPTEDDLIHTVLETVKGRPDVSTTDYVAIAINSLTPVSAESHQYTSAITYRLVRIGDGVNLLPSDAVVGDSGDRVLSDDQGAFGATSAALYKTDQVLPGQISKALRRMQLKGTTSAEAAASTYAVRVDNVASPAATSPIKQALRSAGLGVSTQFNGASRSENITVTLGGKSGQDVVAILEQFLGGYDVGSMDDRATVLRAR
jgi:hypothetical protein